MSPVTRDRDAGIFIGVSRSQRGLVWREWRQHGAFLKGMLAVWTVGLWVLLVFFHPLCILLLGSLYAIYAARDFAGGDQVEGCEEFTFALPPSRSQRFLTRLALSGVPLVFVVVVGVLAIRFEWPQALWSLVVDSGFTGPFWAERHRQTGGALLWDLMGVAVPLALFGWTFSLCALARSRDTVVYAWMAALVIVGTFLAAGLATEYWLLDEVHGSVSTALLLLPALGALHLAHRAHRRKEGTTHPGVSSRASAWTWVLGLALLLFFLFFLGTGYLAVYKAREAAEYERQAARAAVLQAAKARVDGEEEARRQAAGTRDGEGRPAPERPGERKDER